MWLVMVRANLCRKVDLEGQSWETANVLYTNRAESSPVVGGAYKHHNITKNSNLFDILFMINGKYNKGVGEFVSLWGDSVHKYQDKGNFT